MPSRPSRAPAPPRRAAAAAALGLLVALSVAQAQPPKSDSGKIESEKKEPEKKIEWPTSIGGKDIHAVMKDVELSHDPVVREAALRTLPLFGPPAQKKEVSKLLLKRLKGGEPDPSVRVTVFNTVGQIQFESKADNEEALRLLAIYVDAPVGPSAAVYRLRAIQTIALFGPSGEGAITALTGQAMRDPSYETRRSIAQALGHVALDPVAGPNMKALRALAGPLARDECASVRMEALQSIMMVGPPWAEVMKPGAKNPPPIKVADAAVIVKLMRERVGDPNAKPKPIPPTEKDKQVEIWARLVLMRFDPREVNDENINALGDLLSGSELNVKIQALNAFVVVGEMAAKRVTDVIRVMEDKELPLPVTTASIQALAAMGAGAKPALPNLKKLRDEKQKELTGKEVELAKKKDDPKLTVEKVTLEELVKLIDAAIKHIDKAESRSPSETGKSEPPKKP